MQHSMCTSMYYYVIKPRIQYYPIRSIQYFIHYILLAIPNVTTHLIGPSTCCENKLFTPCITTDTICLGNVPRIHHTQFLYINISIIIVTVNNLNKSYIYSCLSLTLYNIQTIICNIYL